MSDEREALALAAGFDAVRRERDDLRDELDAAQRLGADWLVERNALAAKVAAVEHLAKVWEAEVEQGRIVNADARYCWTLAAREVRAELSEVADDE